MNFLIAWIVFGLIAGHVAWGRRWMFDGTRAIVVAYVDLYRTARQKMTAR